MIGAGVHLYVCTYIICIFDPQKCLIGTLAVDLTFQTLAVSIVI